MRRFNLFLRRAGVQTIPALSHNPVSRLTVVCPRSLLADVRRQIYLDFNVAGLRVATMQVDRVRDHDHDMARACITIDCPPELRSVLMSQARQLSSYPGVQQVQWGDRRHIALN